MPKRADILTNINANAQLFSLTGAGRVRFPPQAMPNAVGTA